MTFNFDSSSFSLDQAGLELSLNDFAFDPAQANQVQQFQQQQQHLQQQQQQQKQQQQQLQQQEQRQLQNLLLRDDPSQPQTHSAPAQSQHVQQNENLSTTSSSSSAYDFRTPTISVDMMNAMPSSATTTPVFQTHPDHSSNNNSGKISSSHHAGQSLQQQLQQQHQQQQFILQQQQQRQQQQLHQQQQQQLQQLPQSQQGQAQQQQQQQQVQKDGERRQLLTPAGSEYYSTDYSQYMSPLGIQPETASEATMVMSDQFEDDEVFFTPLISPAMTPSHPFSNLPHAMSTSGEIFSPLSSPALQPHRSSHMDYLSFSGPSFSNLPLQFQQAHQTQLQIQNQLQQLQSQTQSDSSQSSQQPQLQQQTNQGVGTKHARVDISSPALNGQRPALKRRTTVERTAPTLASAMPRSVAGAAGGGGPVRAALPKGSPAMRPLASSTPMSPSALRKQPANSSRIHPSSSVLAPSSPLAMHFSGGSTTNGHIRPTPSPILTSTSQPMSSQAQSQPSPSPHLISNMNHLSMMPASPAMFALPASSMMPPPPSPMILPSQQSQNLVQTPRQLSISQQPGQAQRPPQQRGYQISIHQPIQPTQAPSGGSILKPAGSNSSSVTNTAAMIKIPSATTVVEASESAATAKTMVAVETSSSEPNTPTAALAPVTPGSLMNLSGSESTPTSSPKFTASGKARVLPTKSNNNKNPNSEKSGSKPISSSTSSSKSRGGKRQSGSGMITAGTIAPRTPGAGTPAMISPMPPPPPTGGFATLISPALKPTLMPQSSHHHRGSMSAQTVLVSPRVQPMLVSPSLKPWLPGVSTTEVMARLASKSNYQNILDGDHNALGLSYNTDLHSGIELRRTSHKAAEQKRRDSLKHCFDDLRQMIPTIVDKAPSKVFLLKKSFEYICSLKADITQKDLHIARIEAHEQYFRQQLENWLEASLPEGGVLKRPDMESWRMPEEKLEEVTRREMEVAIIAAQMAKQSAVAVEVSALGSQSGESNEGRGNNGDNSNNNGSGKNGAANSSNNSSNNGKSASRNKNSDDCDDSDNDEEGGPVTASTPGSASATTTSAANPNSLSRLRELGQSQPIGNNARSDKDLSGDVHMSLRDEDEQVQQTQGTLSEARGVSGDTSAAATGPSLSTNSKGGRSRRARSRSTKSGQGEGEEEGEDDYDEDEEEDEDEDDDEVDEDDEDFGDQEMTNVTSANGRPT